MQLNTGCFPPCQFFCFLSTAVGSWLLSLCCLKAAAKDATALDVPRPFFPKFSTRLVLSFGLLLPSTKHLNL